MDTDETEARAILIELESRSGRLRLDRGSFLAEHGDPDWDRAVMGGSVPLPPGRKPIIQMFDTPNIAALRAAAEILAPEHATIIRGLTMGWTSIPVMNACAIRRRAAIAVALNIRLTNVLTHANGLAWNLLQRMAAADSEQIASVFARIRRLLTCANHNRFDLATAEVRPHESFEAYRWALRLAQPQLLFVLLHEYGHVILGHLSCSKFWSGHPLTDEAFEFFSGSQQAEFEADAFAIRALLNPSKWADIRAQIPDGCFDLLDAIEPGRWLIPIQIAQLFLWLHALSPNDPQSYYKVPQSHPHPFDRIAQLHKVLEAQPFFDAHRVVNITRHLRNIYA